MVSFRGQISLEVKFSGQLFQRSVLVVNFRGQFSLEVKFGGQLF